MGAFLRQIIALSALWALCELLLPDGGISRMARLIISLLVMAVLVTSAIDALKHWRSAEISVTETLGVAALNSVEEARQNNEASYAEAYLRSQANQAEDICVRMARGAGYVASAAVYLQADGTLERIDLIVKSALDSGAQPLFSAEELRQKIAEAFMIERSRIRLSVGEGEWE